jgi:hypothetical protein
MSGAVVETETRRESNARFHAVRFDERSDTVLYGLRDMCHSHTGLDIFSSMLANKSMGFGSFADVIVRLLGILHDILLFVTLFFRGRAPSVAEIDMSESNIGRIQPGRTRLYIPRPALLGTSHQERIWIARFVVDRSARAYSSSSWVSSSSSSF